MKKLLLSILVKAVTLTLLHAQWGIPPTGWGDFAIGLTDDGTKVSTISTAIGAGTNLHYRVRYINHDVDTLTNWYSWLPNGGIATNHIADSKTLGMRPAFNIYMLQEERVAPYADYTISNLSNLDFMKRYLWNIIDVAKKANGSKAAFIIEPDTWGYLIQKCYPSPTSAGSGDPSIRPNLIFAHVNDLGYPHLSSFPNTLTGLAQGIIKTIRTFAPDATVGFHTNHWATWSNGATGPACLGTLVGSIYTCSVGMPFWSTTDIDAGVDFQIAWYNELLGGSAACDRGDFLVVEKWGGDEGARWMAFGAIGAGLYYGNTQYQNWLHWCKRMGQGINLPLLGWQIPVGHTGLGNSYPFNKYEDTFMQYFFGHTSEFYCAGFIGLFMGPGTGSASTYYTNGPGTVGDDGWLFSNLRTSLDPTRPIDMNLSTNGCGETINYNPACGILPINLISFTANLINNQSIIKWVTSDEKKVHQYVLKKSIDGKNFYTLATIEANSKNGIYHYSFNDPEVISSVVYYKLQSIDEDGSFMESEIISLSSTENPVIKVFPNPASKNIFVLVSDESKDAILHIRNDLGVEVLLMNLKPGVNPISIENLNPTLYYFTIVDSSLNYIYSKKIKVE